MEELKAKWKCLKLFEEEQGEIEVRVSLHGA